MSSIMFILLLLTSFVLSDGVGTVRTLTETEKQNIVDNLNSFRNSELVVPAPRPGTMRTINWNATLENYARIYASKCIWGHSTPGVNGQRPSNVGENLYVFGTSGVVLTSSLIHNAHTSWQNERLSYQLSTNTCNEGAVCGHYTVIVKDINDGVGCAIADCSTLENTPSTMPSYPNMVYMVCNYNGQNINGVAPYTTDVVESTQTPTTTATPTNVPTTPPFVELQDLAKVVFDRLNVYKTSVLNQAAYLQTSVGNAFLRSFTVRQTTARSGLPVDLRAGIVARNFGSADWCYRGSMPVCSDSCIYDWLLVNKFSSINSTRFKYFSIAYSINGSLSYWTPLWSSQPGVEIVTNVMDFNTLENDQ